MPIAYSTDLRTRIIAAWEAKEGSQRQVAARFKVSLSFVQRVLRRYRQTGQRDALRRGATLSPVIVAEYLNLVQTLVAEQPDALLKELCESLRERTGIKVSVPTMHRAVQRLRLRRKKRCGNASEQDTPRIQQIRHDYRRWLNGVDIHNLVFIDEAGVNLGLTRLYGRAISSERVVDSRPRNVGENVSLYRCIELERIDCIHDSAWQRGYQCLPHLCNPGINTAIMDRSDCANG